MHSHAMRGFMGVIFVLFNVDISIFLVDLVVVRRQLKRGLKGLLDVFDPGSAVVGDKFVVGLFQGRSAWVSLASDRFDELYISVRGWFSLPFEAQTLQARRSTRIRAIARGALGLLTWFGLLLPMHATDTFHRITFDNLLQSCAWLLCSMVFLCLPFLGWPYPRGRSRKAPIARVDAQLTCARLTPFETTQPERFRAALNQPGIRESLAYIFDSCHADGVMAPADGFDSIGAFWLFPGGALKKQVLDKEAVRQTLSELSSLCTGAEQLFPKPV